MRLKLIACKALTREMSYLASLSENNIDITFIRQGYHETPDILRRTLQQEIDAVESGRDPHTNDLGGNGNAMHSYNDFDFDAILIGYGLCSNGIVGLRSGRHTLVIPRGHDCITFFLGSKERYAECFKTLPGCFWYTASWIENADLASEGSNQRMIEYYRKKGYDEDELEFLLEDSISWTKNYKTAAYIKMPFFDKEEHQQFTRDAAAYFGWNFEMVDGDMGLLKRFLDGDWNEEDFLIVPPGHMVTASFGASIMSCEKCEDE